MSISSSKPQVMSGTTQTTSVPRSLYTTNISTPSRVKNPSARSSIPHKPSTTLRRPSKVVPAAQPQSLETTSLPKLKRNTEPQIQIEKNQPTDPSDNEPLANSSRFGQNTGFISRIPVRKTSMTTELSSNAKPKAKDTVLATKKNVLQTKTNSSQNTSNFLLSHSKTLHLKTTSASRIPILSTKAPVMKSLVTRSNSLSAKSSTTSLNRVDPPAKPREKLFSLSKSKSQVLPDLKSSTNILKKKVELRTPEKSTTGRAMVSSGSEDREASKNTKRLNLGPPKTLKQTVSKTNSQLNLSSDSKTRDESRVKRTIPTALSRPENSSNPALKPLSSVKSTPLLKSNPGLKSSTSLTHLKTPSDSVSKGIEILSTSKVAEDKSIDPYSSHTLDALRKIHRVMVARGTPGAKSRASRLSAIIAARSNSEDLSILKDSPKAVDISETSMTSHYVPRAVPKELSKIPQPPSFPRTPVSKRVSSTFRKSHHDLPTVQRSQPEVPPENPGPPFSPRDVLKNIGYKLSAYEQSEILQFSEIYYCGNNGSASDPDKKYMQNFSSPEGDMIFKITDHLAYRYEIHKILGKGSFGQVVQAYDYKHKRDVAIKIIKSSEKFQRQALTEIGILEVLTRHDKDRIYNVLHITGSFRFRKHLCIVTELYGLNLYEHIKVNQFSGFRPSLVHNYAVQILKCLCLLKANNLVHCDLKPENILLAGPNTTQIKVIDFGSSCYEDQRIYTYIQSRFYRSPEVVLEMPYGTAIDMWSFGCIIVELLTGYPIFPGESEPELMARIIEVVGLPDVNYISKSRRRVSYFDISGNLRTSHRYKKRTPGAKPLHLILKNADEMLIDFVSKCLQFVPEKRMTPQEALNHPWITGSRSSTSSSIEAESPLFAVNHAPSEAATLDYIHRHPELFQQPIFSYDLANKTVNPHDPNGMYRY